MPKTIFGFRLDRKERARLEEHAEELAIPESELARRYVAEGLRMDKHPGVIFVSGPDGHRRPALASRPRLFIADVVETWLLHGRDTGKTARYFEAERSEIEIALRYYAEFRNEIDERLEKKKREAERLRGLLVSTRK